MLTRKRSTYEADVRQSSLREARSARWPTASPTKISTGAKLARASPARLTKTLPAGAPAAAAAADAGAAKEGPAPAAAAATEDAGAAAPAAAEVAISWRARHEV
jgi:hypothetical protein